MPGPVQAAWCDLQVANWRSEIMNFTLTLIYPAPSDQGFKNISVSELVCVVTADQTCSSSFFANLLRFIDSGARLPARRGCMHGSPVLWCRCGSL